MTSMNCGDATGRRPTFASTRPNKTPVTLPRPPTQTTVIRPRSQPRSTESSAQELEQGMTQPERPSVTRRKTGSAWRRVRFAGEPPSPYPQSWLSTPARRLPPWRSSWFSRSLLSRRCPHLARRFVCPRDAASAVPGPGLFRSCGHGRRTVRTSTDVVHIKLDQYSCCHGKTVLVVFVTNCVWRKSRPGVAYRHDHTSGNERITAV